MMIFKKRKKKVELRDACSYSQILMSYLDDSHFPGSQSLSESREVLYKLLVWRVSSETHLLDSRGETGS